MKKEIKYHTKEEALEAIIQDSANELKYCTPEIQNNEEVVMEAVKQDSLSFYHASAELKSNKAFIMKALNEGVCLINHSNVNIQSDTDIMSLVLEKSIYGIEFKYAEGEAAINKELAAKALVKWGAKWGTSDLGLWKKIHPSLQAFFPKDCWHEKAQSYLIQLEQEKRAEMVAGGSTTEDAVVW